MDTCTSDACHVGPMVTVCGHEGAFTPTCTALGAFAVGGSVAVMATTTMDTCSCVALFVVHVRGGNDEGWTVSLKCILADKVSLF